MKQKGKEEEIKRRDIHKTEGDINKTEVAIYLKLFKGFISQSIKTELICIANFFGLCKTLKIFALLATLLYQIPLQEM